MVKCMSLEAASKTVAQIFNIIGNNENGKQTMRCSRCEGFDVKTRGKGFALLSFATTKAGERIAVYCPGINTKEDSFDASLRHTLLVNLPKGVLSTIKKVGLALPRFHCVCMIVSTTVPTCLFLGIFLLECIHMY